VSDLGIDAVTTPKIQNNAVTSEKIASDAVISDKIGDGTILRADVDAAFKAPYADTADYALAASVGYADSAGVSANSWRLENNTLTALDSRWVNESQGNSITSGMIVDGEVTSTDIFNNTVTEADISDAFVARDSDRVDGYNAGNFSGGVAVSNGAVCSNLNADMLDGYHGSAYERAYYEGTLPVSSSTMLIIPHYALWSLSLACGHPDDGGVASVTGFENDWNIAVTYTCYNGDGTWSSGGSEGAESSTDTLLTFGQGLYIYTVSCPGEQTGDHNIVLSASGVELRYKLVY